MDKTITVCIQKQVDLMKRIKVPNHKIQDLLKEYVGHELLMKLIECEEKYDSFNYMLKD